MKKNLVNNEIDLIEVFQIIWRKKNYVILSIVISLFLALLTHIYLVKFNIKIKLDTITKVSPIQIVEESNYQNYSLALQLVVEPLTQHYLNSDSQMSTNTKRLQLLEDSYRYSRENSVEISNITKNFLFKMFLEEISQRNHLENLIKKFNLIKEENYPNKIKYKNAIDEIISNIRILNLDNVSSKNEFYQITIEYQTDNINNWENFLEFLEVETNLTIRTKLIRMFNNYLDYLRIIQNFQTEDIKDLLLTAQNDKEKIILEKRLGELKLKKHIERLNVIFNSSHSSSLVIYIMFFKWNASANVLPSSVAPTQ